MVWNSWLSVDLRADPIGEDPETLHAVLARQDLDQRVGIGNRCRVIAYDDHDLLAGLRRAQHTRRDPWRGVDDQRVHFGGSC